MTSTQRGTAGPGNKRLFLAAAIGILLVAVLSYTSSLALSTEPAAPPAQSPQQPPNLRPGYMQRVDLLAEQSGGNLHKLSAVDQIWLDRMLHGSAAEVIRARAKALKKEGDVGAGETKKMMRREVSR